MADWNFIECDFNALDETLNFGTRNFAGIENLYETSTLASLKNDEVNVSVRPFIKVVIRNESIFFAINKTMRVFGDLQCSDISFSATFDENIDTFCVTSDGKYLLLCLRDGAVHCFDVQNDAEMIYADTVVDNNNKDLPFFIDVFVENCKPLSFLTVLRSGKVYRIGAAEMSLNESGNELSKFSATLLHSFNKNVQTTTFNYPILFLSGTELSMYNVQTNEVASEEMWLLKKIFPYNSRLLIGLDQDGHLINICSRSFITYYVNNDTLFEDILVHNSTYGSRLLGITKKDENGDSYLQFMSYPEHSSIFSIKMKESIHLIIPEHIHDEIMYLSEIKHGELIAELRFQTVSETSPENRLKRLLRRQKFDEAELCAKLFGLDIIEVQKAKAQVIVDKTVCDENDINNLMDILNVINDYVFQIHSCLNIHAYCTAFEYVEKILKYGYFLPLPESIEVVSEEILCFHNLIVDLMFRFNTFIMLTRCGNLQRNVQDWVDFSTCDLIKELTMAIEQHRIQESIIIYNRLDTTTISNLEEEDISAVLNVLNNVPLENQLPFLNTFIPLSLSYLPSTLNLFIKWMLETIYNIEIKYPNKFPENALSFMDKMVQLLKIECFTSINFHQQDILDFECLQKVSNIRKGLEKLQILKNSYGIVIPLQNFLQGTDVLVQTLLSSAIYSIGNECFLEDFMHKFILDSQLNPNDIFGTLIRDIVEYEEEYWIKIAPTILNCINSINEKLEQVLVILKAATVPWCPTIREIANASLQYSHPLVEEIIQQIEFEPKCVILKKDPYKLTKQYINTVEYLKFAIGRIIYCNQPTMIDDIYQICKDSKEKHEADMLLIYHFIKIGDTKNALLILDNNSKEDVIKCCKKLVVFATFAIENQYKIKSLQDNCYDIIKPVFERLRNNCDVEFEKEYLQENVENLVNLYRIQKHFNIDISYKDLDNKNCRDIVLQNLITNVSLEFQKNNDILSCMKSTEKISLYLQIDKSTALLQLCKQICNFNVILEAAECILVHEDDNYKSLCYIVTLILKHLGLPNITSETSGEESFLKNINMDVNIFIKGLKLARKIIITSILKCEKNYLGNCLELANWIETTYCLINNSKLNLTGSYSNDMILPSISVLNAVKDVFYFYINVVGNCNSPNTKYLMYFNHDVPKMEKMQLEKEIQTLNSTIKYLCAEGHALTAYKLLITLQRSLVHNLEVDAELLKHLKEIISQSTKQLLLNLFAARHIDEELVYSLLINSDIVSSKSLLFQSLKYYKRDVIKFEVIAKICFRFLQYNKIEDGQFICRNIIYLAKWWKKFKSGQISYEEFFKKSPDQVLEKLIKFNSLDVTSVENFCSDFKLNLQSYYQFYLKNFLINWKSCHEIQMNRFGKRELIVQNTENHLFLNCMEVINVIDDKEAILKLMDHLWEKVNFYHYEVFMCILNIQLTLKSNIDNNQKNLMLIFLKNYNRASKPSQAEMEQWFTLYPDTQYVDFLSEWRLPFTPTLFSNKIWSIIRPEINLKTYTKWFEAISILKKYLNKDDICSYVIKEILSSGVFQYESSEEWVLHSKHKDLLKEIDTCIENMSNFEQATSAVYSLVTNIPGGADRLKACALCYKYALMYQQQFPQSQDVQKAVTKVKKKYFNYATIHILHKNQLAEKEYLDKISCPAEELIEALYMDSRIIKKAAFVTSYCPDINKAVDEIAKLHNLNDQEIRCALLNRWLMSDVSTAHLDFNTDVYVTSEINSTATSKHLIRATYLCTSGDVSVWRTWLLKAARLETNDSINLNFKAMTLKCLCSISDPNTIEKLIGTAYDEVKVYINKLMLISNLERFGLSLSLESLDGYNKHELLKRLSYHVTGPTSLKTMALICITYTIYEFKFWALIIKTMLKFNMFEELKECINFLKSNSALYNNVNYIEAWQAVINNCFNNIATKDEDCLRSLFVENFYFIQSCPVLSHLNLEYVVKRCLELNQSDFAALAAQHLPEEKQKLYIKEILLKDTHIFKKIEEIGQFGFLGETYVKNLLGRYQEELREG